ncbi:SDR family oxidoreductase [Vibrio sp. Isolate31]|uniref:SDR family NAD(P)-dependent oxidoreductase n=1 Tax=unclassified Vibrio TaxID=2614977 RepID=UPI001EFD1B27|nr:MULTISPECIES: SDR family oxidoreductase [unclassified Vibrio]MCG9554328.1 SDR family oxidoreductase [Vibrio sp. Isolate32]MCG9603167.1 SDR family oxidoreductase [Vibrio sp. Isolate31]
MDSLLNTTHLADRVAFVTGGSSGIGRAMAITLAKAGAQVIVVARRAEPLNETVNIIRSLNGNASALVADLSDLSKLDDIVKSASEPFGPPDIIVNAAGVNLREPIDAITSESWDQTLNINLKTPFFVARAFMPAMKNQGWGKVINIASLQSQRAFANSLPYGASKGGVAQMTRAMAEAWSCFGITCNAIAPGFFPTELTEEVFSQPEHIAKLASQTALGRNGKLTDLDGPLLFLSSSASDYVTGQILYVDGGFTAK